MKKEKKKRFSIAQAGYLLFCSSTMLLYMTEPVFAATVWEKATEIMKDVYGQIVAISTIAAVVTAAIALLMMNFSRSGRTVDESSLHGQSSMVLDLSWHISHHFLKVVNGRHKQRRDFLWEYLMAL